MRTRLRLTLALLMLALVGLTALGGCMSPDDPVDGQEAAAADVFPFPVDEDGFVDRGFTGIEHFDVDIPSPVGGTIHAEVYVPADMAAHDQVPVIVEVSPYHALQFRQLESPIGNGLQPTYMIDRFVARGYGVVFADVRGFGGSSGCWDDHGDDEMADTVAAVEWASRQPWSTGDVGMVGFSYPGATAIQAAVGQAQGLRTMFLLGPVSSVYENHWQNGVAYRWDYVLPSATHFSAAYPAAAAAPPWTDAGSYGGYVGSATEQANCLPETTSHLNDLDGRYTDYFAERDRQDDVAAVNVSVFWVHGFWDENVKPSLFTPMWASLDTPKRAWFWHGYHHAPTEATSGRLDGADQQHLWFDHWLYGYDNGIVDRPVVEVQDSLGRWRYEEAWPPADAEPLRFVPAASGVLSMGGNGAGTASFSTDPYTSFSDGCMEGGSFETCGPIERVPAGAHFTAATAPLAEPLHLSGLPNFTVRLSSDDTHGQVVVGLFDVDPGGTWTLVSEAAMGLRHREGLHKVVNVVPGETMDLSFDGWPTDWVFEKGHRIATVYVGTEFRYVTPDTRHTLTIELGEGTATALPVIPWRNETFDQTDSSALVNRPRMGPPEGYAFAGPARTMGVEYAQPEPAPTS